MPQVLTNNNRTAVQQNLAEGAPGTEDEIEVTMPEDEVVLGARGFDYSEQQALFAMEQMRSQRFRLGRVTF